MRKSNLVGRDRLDVKGQGGRLLQLDKIESSESGYRFLVRRGKQVSLDLEEEAPAHSWGTDGAGGDGHIFRMDLGMEVFGERLHSLLESWGKVLV